MQVYFSWNNSDLDFGLGLGLKPGVSVLFWKGFCRRGLWGCGLWIMREPITEPHWSMTLLFSTTSSCISVKSFKNTQMVWVVEMLHEHWCFTAALPSSFILHCMSLFFLHVCFFLFLFWFFQFHSACVQYGTVY